MTWHSQVLVFKVAAWVPWTHSAGLAHRMLCAEVLCVEFFMVLLAEHLATVDVQKLHQTCSYFRENLCFGGGTHVAVSGPANASVLTMYRVLKLAKGGRCKILLSMEECDKLIDRTNIARVVRYIGALEVVALDLGNCSRMMAFDETTGVIAHGSTLNWLSLQKALCPLRNDLGRLGNALGRCVALAHLDMGGCNLSGAMVGGLLRLCGRHLKTLDLSYNKIVGEGGMQAVVECLVKMQGVCELNLEGNKIGVSGVVVLLTALPLLPAMRYVSFIDCVGPRTWSRSEHITGPLLDGARRLKCSTTMWNKHVKKNGTWGGNGFEEGHHMRTGNAGLYLV